MNTELCACGKQRRGLNNTNWIRHINTCKKRKFCSNNSSIVKFFKSSRVTGIY